MIEGYIEHNVQLPYKDRAISAMQFDVVNASEDI